jgi:hypothetical protein
MHDEDYVLTHIDSPELLSPQQKDRLLTEIDRLALSVWEVNPRIHREQRKFFWAGSWGATIISRRAEVVAFSLYLRLDATFPVRLIYRYGSAVAEAHQGHGLYGEMSTFILATEMRKAPDEPLYCCWRTRNPKVWAATARQCVRVCPSILDRSQDADLAVIANAAAERLYPKLELQQTGMLMPGAYDFLKYRHAQNHSDATIDRHFNELPDQCAVFSVGLLKSDLVEAVPRFRARSFHGVCGPSLFEG